MRRLSLLALVLVLALGAGAAMVFGQTASDPLGDALGYLPRDAALVGVVATDLQGDQLTNLDAKLRALGMSEPGGIAGSLRSASRELGLDFDQNVAPLLGNELVVGVPTRRFDEDSEAFVVALEVQRADLVAVALDRPRAIRPLGSFRGARLFRLRDGTALAVNGVEVVLADSAPTIKRAINRRLRPDRLTRAGFEQRLGAPPEPSFFRGYARLGGQLGRYSGVSARQVRRVPWLAALRNVGVSLSASPNGLAATALVTTNPRRLRERDLPLAAGAVAPSAVVRPRETVYAERNSAQSARFALDLIRAFDPRGDFERTRRRLERAARVSLRRDLVGQLTGTSVATFTPRGRFAVRQEVRDPAALAATLRRIEPKLERVLRRSRDFRRVRVRPMRGARDLYFASEGRDRLVFGVVGGLFVAGSDERRARALASQPLVALSGAPGAAQLRLDARSLLGDELEAPARAHLGQLAVAGEADTARLRLGTSLEVR